MGVGGIGFFDSGIGGLTLLDECARRFPDQTFLYYGDNANAPYGNRPHSEIFRLTDAVFAQFEELRVRAAVIACNTVTAECVDQLRAKYPFPIIGVEPAVNPALKVCRNPLILVTRATSESARFHRLTENREVTVFVPGRLVSAIEGCAPDFDRIDLARHLPRGDFGGVVLGCTHFVFLRDQISSFYGLPVFDGNEGAAKRLGEILNLQTGDGGAKSGTGISGSEKVSFHEKSSPINVGAKTLGNGQMYGDPKGNHSHIIDKELTEADGESEGENGCKKPRTDRSELSCGKRFFEKIGTTDHLVKMHEFTHCFDYDRQKIHFFEDKTHKNEHIFIFLRNRMNKNSI